MPQLYDIPEKLKLATCVTHTTYHIGHQPTSYLHKFPWYKALWRHTRSHGELPRPTPSMHYVPLPNRPFAVCHINNVISSKRTFSPPSWSTAYGAFLLQPIKYIE